MGAHDATNGNAGSYTLVPIFAFGGCCEAAPFPSSARIPVAALPRLTRSVKQVGSAVYYSWSGPEY